MDIPLIGACGADCVSANEYALQRAKMHRLKRALRDMCYQHFSQLEYNDDRSRWRANDGFVSSDEMAASELAELFPDEFTYDGRTLECLDAKSF